MIRWVGVKWTWLVFHFLDHLRLKEDEENAEHTETQPESWLCQTSFIFIFVRLDSNNLCGEDFKGVV